MQMLFEFLPIIIFFVVYKLNGIFAATGAAMTISAIQVLFFWIKHKRIDTIQIVMLLIIGVLGGLTIAFHDPIFIKWKTTIVYGLFALIFLITQFFGKKPLVQRMLDKKVTLTDSVWRSLNWSWIVFFVVMAAANLYVAYHYSTDAWVNFKLFGVLGFTVVFILLQALYLSKHIQHD